MVGSYFSKIINLWSSVVRWEKYSKNIIGARIKQMRNKNTIRNAFGDLKDAYKLMTQEVNAYKKACIKLMRRIF